MTSRAEIIAELQARITGYQEKVQTLNFLFSHAPQGTEWTKEDIGVLGDNTYVGEFPHPSRPEQTDSGTHKLAVKGFVQRIAREDGYRLNRLPLGLRKRAPRYPKQISLHIGSEIKKEPNAVVYSQRLIWAQTTQQDGVVIYQALIEVAATNKGVAESVHVCLPTNDEFNTLLPISEFNLSQGQGGLTPEDKDRLKAIMGYSIDGENFAISAQSVIDRIKSTIASDLPLQHPALLQSF